MLKVHDYSQFKSKAQTGLERFVLKILMPFISYLYRTKKKKKAELVKSLSISAENIMFFPSLNQ